MIENKVFSPIILSGPSGAGKTEFIEYLMRKDNIFCEAPGITTRPRREGEVGATDFVSLDQFLEFIKNDKLIQYAKYNDNYYGTLKTALDLLKDKQVLFNMGFNGAMALKELRPDSSLIYVLPPNKEEIIKRMGDRDKKRYGIGIEQTMKSIDVYDYLLISYTNDLDRVYDDFINIFSEGKEGSNKSLKLEKNRDFMRNFYN